MKIIQNLKAISRLLFILLLLLAIIIGAIFSYLMVAGYYLNLKIRVPENTTVSVLDVTFDPQDVETFNITLLNPTYSPTDAEIKEISVVTQDETVYTITSINPQLPFQLDKGQDETFSCEWNWAEYSGQTVKVIVLVEDGSGSAYEVETSPVRLSITATIFATANSQYFNLTVNNHYTSIIDLEFTDILVTMDDGAIVEITEVSPPLPYVVPPDSSQDFRCYWDWTNYRDRNLTITVFTSEGYTASRSETTPKPVQLSVTDPIFDSTNTSIFNITVTNSEHSITPANLTYVELLFADQTSFTLGPSLTSNLPFELPIGESVTIQVLWDWSDRRGESVAVTVKTEEEYFGIIQATLP